MRLRLRISSSLPESSEKGASGGPEPMAFAASPEFSKQKELTNSEPVIRKVTELKPAGLEVDATEVSRKPESKSQKTLFDF